MTLSGGWWRRYRHREGLKQHSFLICDYLTTGRSSANPERSSPAVFRNPCRNQHHLVGDAKYRLPPRLAESGTLGWGLAICVLTSSPGDSDTYWSLRITDRPICTATPWTQYYVFWCLTGIGEICICHWYMWHSMWHINILPIRHETNGFILFFCLIQWFSMGMESDFCPPKNIGWCLKTFLVVTLEGRCYWHLVGGEYWVLNILQCSGQTPHSKELTNPKCQQSQHWEPLVNLTEKAVSLGSLLSWGKEKAGWGNRHPVCRLWTQIFPRVVRNVYWLVTDSVYCWSVKEVGALWP